MKSFQLVQEAYVGRSKNLLEAEGYLKEIIKLLTAPSLDAVPKRVITAAQLNKSDLNIKLQNCLKEEFGFGEMIIRWNGNLTANAGSTHRGIIKSIANDMPNFPIKQGDKYYDGGHEYLCCIQVYAGLIDAGFTADELLAIILHEIGHNFQCTIISTMTLVTDFVWIPVYMKNIGDNYDKLSGEMGDYNRTMNYVRLFDIRNEESRELLKLVFSNKQSAVEFLWHGLLEMVTLSTTVTRLYHYIKNALKVLAKSAVLEYSQEILKLFFEKCDAIILSNKQKTLKEWKEYIAKYKKAKARLESEKNFINLDFIESLVVTVVKYMSFGNVVLAHDIYNIQTRYSGEVFADSFATSYGYGPQLISAYTKLRNLRLEKAGYQLNENNPRNTFNQYNYMLLEVFRMIMDPHPIAQTRAKNQIDVLKSALEQDDIPKELKDQIKKDIKLAEERYKAFMKLPDEYKHCTAIMSWYRFNEAWFDGKIDVRNPINKILNFGKENA